MKLVYVDGYKIRQNLDPDFNIVHLNGNPALFDSKWYIPKGEIWLDHCFKDEKEFLLGKLVSKRKKKPPAFIIKEKTENGIKIQYVDGEIVRQYLEQEFVLGGHDLIYNYIPAKTIWIDYKLDKRDIPHILLHEITERKLMAQGKNYDIAHDYATAAEKESRRKAGGVYIGDANHSGKFLIKNYYAR